MSLCLCVCKPFVCDQPLVLPPSLKDNLLDFGVCSATHTSSIIFVVVNSNPIEVRGRSTKSCVCCCRSPTISNCLCDSSEFLKCAPAGRFTQYLCRRVLCNAL